MEKEEVSFGFLFVLTLFLGDEGGALCTGALLLGTEILGMFYLLGFF